MFGAVYRAGRHLRERARELTPGAKCATRAATLAHIPSSLTRHVSGGAVCDHGSTRKPHQFRLGMTKGLLRAYALLALNEYGGVLEHPSDSKAWRWFGLRAPKRHVGWQKPPGPLIWWRDGALMRWSGSCGTRSTLSDLNHAEVIRQAETLEEALRGL